MARVRLVRHAEPLEVIGVDPDLTPLGFQQAAALVARLPPCELVTSPLRRARSTAQPLADAWGVDAVVEDAVRELPSPTTTMAERQTWLRLAMRGCFADLDAGVAAWREAIGEFVTTRRVDTVVVTHAIVINAVVGMCTGDDRVLHVRPAHTSITTVEVDDDGRLTLVERGHEADSIIR